MLALIGDTVDNIPGALYKTLEPIADRGINMTRIVSRPARNEVWRYLFFVDIDGHQEDPQVRSALEEIEHDKALAKVMLTLLKDDTQVYKQFVENESFRRFVTDALDSFAGAWIHAVGAYTDADGKSKRAAISIGPEHGAVGPSKDCAYEGPVMKVVSCVPISMEGKSSSCAHFSPLGNIAGGSLMVGLAYWFIYLRKPASDA